MKGLQTLAAALLSSACLASSADTPPTSPSPPFHRLATMDGRDWILALGGAPFFAAGVCHVHTRGSHSHALGFSPYKRFVEENYSSPESWADETAARLRDWGFTSLGAASDIALFAGRGFPHVSHSALRMGQNFATGDPEHSICPSKGAPCTALPNVFHPDFAAHCEKIAAERCAAAKDDPFLLGWYIDNELAWWGKNGQRATGVFDAIVSFPPAHSARQELERWLAVNQRSVAAAPSTALKLAFLRHFARTYFEITTAAIRHHDPNHLILGCRFAGLQGAHPVVWEACGEFCDVVSFNCYPWADLDHGVVLDEKCGVPMAERFAEYHGYAKKPMIVSEWSFPALDTGRPCFKGAGQRVPTQRERTEASALFLRTMLAQPFVVGCEYFMWCDRPAQGGHKANAEDCNYGLVNEQGEPYAELLAALSPILRNAAALRGAAILPPTKQRVDSAKPSERDRYVAEAALFATKNAKGRKDVANSVFFEAGKDGSWLLSNAFVRVSGRIGSAFMADALVISPAPESACPVPEASASGPPESACPVPEAACSVPEASASGPLGRLGALLQLVDDGTNAWIDTSCVTDVERNRDPETGIASVTLRAVTEGIPFAITTRLSLAPDSRELLAEILSVENLGDRPIEGWLPFLRPWSLEAKPEPVRMVLDRWAAPCEAEWRLPDGGSWGIRSSDISAKRFRFFTDPRGGQHPDARFSAVDSQGRAANYPIAPAEVWRPASPMAARIYRKSAEGGPR